MHVTPIDHAEHDFLEDVLLYRRVRTTDDVTGTCVWISDAPLPTPLSPLDDYLCTVRLDGPRDHLPREYEYPRRALRVIG